MKRVAHVKGTTPLFSYDPPLGHSYPLWVGKTWEEINQITFHRMGSTFGVLTKWKVEAQEGIKGPAGTFKVFRVIRLDVGQEDTDWSSLDLGISLKYKIQRNAGHPNGSGVPGSRGVGQQSQKRLQFAHAQQHQDFYGW